MHRVTFASSSRMWLAAAFSLLATSSSFGCERGTGGEDCRVECDICPGLARIELRYAPDRPLTSASVSGDASRGECRRFAGEQERLQCSFEIEEGTRSVVFSAPGYLDTKATFEVTKTTTEGCCKCTYSELDQRSLTLELDPAYVPPPPSPDGK